MNYHEDIPAICQNKDCENYKAFELYDVDEVKDPRGKSYVICFYCKEKIIIED